MTDTNLSMGEAMARRRCAPPGHGRNRQYRIPADGTFQSGMFGGTLKPISRKTPGCVHRGR
ncbi:MAG: hypothetical protein ACLS6G_12870 [Christensenellales bacterium]